VLLVLMDQYSFATEGTESAERGKSRMDNLVRRFQSAFTSEPTGRIAHPTFLFVLLMCSFLFF